MEHSNYFRQLSSNLTAYQNSLYVTSQQTKELPCVYNNEINKSTWTYKFPEFLMPDPKDNSIVFKCKLDNHALVQTDLIQHLPSIICKPGFKAKWTESPGLNIVKTGQLILNEKELQFVSDLTNDIFLQSMLPSTDKTMVNNNLGNVAFLQTPSEVLPSFDTSFTIPWFYNRTPTSYFPLHYCGSSDKFEHKLSLRRKISELLIVYDSNGNIVPADEKSLYKIGDDITSTNTINHKLTYPEMLGTFVFFGDDELKIKDENEIKSLHIEDVKVFSSKNSEPLGKVSVVEIKGFKYPIIRYGWFARNKNALSHNCYNNYSTNKFDRLLGWSPIKKVKFFVDNAIIFDDLPGFMFERIFPMSQFPSVPDASGIGLWNNNFSVNTDYTQSSIIFTDGTFDFTLSNMDPTQELDNQNCNDVFDTFVILTYIKTINFEKSKDGIKFTVLGSTL